MTDLHKPVQPGAVHFYHVDAREAGGSEWHLCDSGAYDTPLPEDNQIQMGSIYWRSLPIAAEGYGRGNVDSPLRPTLTIPDFRGYMLRQLEALPGGGAGVRITRYTLLVTEVDPDIMWWRTRDKYLLNTKSYTGSALTLELAKASDFRRVTIPSQSFMREKFPGLGSVNGR